ncbi:MAG: hypothetical protein V7646_5888 [Pseudonocardia sp.]
MRGESDRSAEIGTLVDQVIRHYVFPDIAEEICRVLRERLDAGAYRALADEDFAAAVTEDLQSVNGDKHLRLRCSVEPVRPQSDAVLDDHDRRLQEAELAGHGFAKVERLAGNVGLLDVRALFEASVSGAAAGAAMNLVASADVLLIDLRRNGGGDPAMVALLCSYLFDEPTHLNDLYFRSDDSITQYWTHAFVPGAKFGGSKPVYVLTSGETFSGAEELCYNLQQLRRASLVGETTRGGAHPGNRHRITDHLVATVPTGRAINPVSGTNWEGVGVTPDIAVAAEHAFEVAYQRALEHVLTLSAHGARHQVAEQAQQAFAERVLETSRAQDGQRSTNSAINR